jgi:hypothetical protein
VTNAIRQDSVLRQKGPALGHHQHHYHHGLKILHDLVFELVLQVKSEGIRENALGTWSLGSYTACPPSLLRKGFQMPFPLVVPLPPCPMTTATSTQQACRVEESDMHTQGHLVAGGQSPPGLISTTVHLVEGQLEAEA